MQIKRLRLSGFKSFVDAADLRIEPGLTGIVGPNGCGKSNLLEALRWVMGETSARSMRGAGMEDVIFAGTATRPQRDFAEVSVLAEGIDGELEVVRRIERGAGSAYRLNGRDVRAKDVSLVFADAATGAHSPALVSQGRIGAVISARPADRRAMLEEAAGIAGLHVRRRDAEQKLRATEANLAKLDEAMAEMDSRIGALRRQARHAERYRTLSASIRVAEARMIFARWRDAAAAADTARAEADVAETRVVAATGETAAALAAQEAATTALATARTASLVAHDAAKATNYELTRLRAERAETARRIESLDRERARMAADREREDVLAIDAAAALARLDDEARATEARVADAAARTPALATALAEAERLARDAEVALAQALAAQAAELADQRVADAALAAADAWRGRAAVERDRIAAAAAALDDTAPLAARRDAAAETVAKAATGAASARAAIAGAEAAALAASLARDSAASALAEARATLAALDSESRALAKATAIVTGGGVIDRLRAAPGYEAALAAALGDDLAAGTDRSRERYWGGADALPGDPTVPAGATRLSEHVTGPSELARRLAQVAVAQDDVGQALAVGQRLVTLAGVLRRWDGYVARSGGAVAAERLVRLNRLAEIAAQRSAADAQVKHCADTLVEADAAIGSVRTAEAEARAAHAAAETIARAAARDEDQARAALDRIESRARDLAGARARAVTELGEAEREAAGAAAARAALPETHSTTATVATLQATAESNRGDVARAKGEAIALERQVAGERERLAATQAEAKGWRARAGEAARRIAEMDVRAIVLEQEAAVLADRPESFDATIAKHEAEAAAALVAAAGARTAEAHAEAVVRDAEARARAVVEALAQAREARAGAVARAENQELRRVEMGRVAGERFECSPPVLPEKAGFAADTVRGPGDESTAHERLMLERERIGPVNLVADSELAEIEAARTSSTAEHEELGLAVNRLRGSIGSLNREGRARLLAAFEAVNGHFGRLFATLFDGGQAYLELIDSDDPLEAGLEIMAQPPGKRLQSLTLLSGGEQALTAVALIFGLFLTNPAPICVLDEVDAPLDDANIDRFCHLLDAMVRETATRYLIVTHNAVTMSRMHRLFGVTMIERGVSRLVSVDLGGAEQLLAAE